MLGRLPGVIKIKADHESQKVHLTLNEDKTTLDEVKEKLGFMGYETAA